MAHREYDEVCSVTELMREAVNEAVGKENLCQEAYNHAHANADKEITAKLEMMFFLQKEELASLPFTVLGLRVIKTLLHLMDWADVTWLTQPQCLNVFVILKDFGIIHNEEFIELWRSSPELRESLVRTL